MSEESRADFAATYRIAGSRIQVARQGVQVPPLSENAQRRKHLLQLIGARDHAPLLVHVGNFAPEKNHVGLLDAFAQVLRRCPDSRLVLLGDGPLRAEIESYIDKLNIRQSVHLLGPRTDAPCLVAGADLMLVASHVEGIPGVVLEACARAVPVVATNVGGLAEIIEHGQTGLLVPKDDMTTLAGETIRLIHDEVTRRRLGQAAREFVSRHYNLIASVTECIEIYRSLMGAR